MDPIIYIIYTPTELLTYYFRDHKDLYLMIPAKNRSLQGAAPKLNPPLLLDRGGFNLGVPHCT